MRPLYKLLIASRLGDRVRSLTPPAFVFRFGSCLFLPFPLPCLPFPPSCSSRNDAEVDSICSPSPYWLSLLYRECHTKSFSVRLTPDNQVKSVHTSPLTGALGGGRDT